MYLDYWGLTQSPFAEVPSPRFYYRGPDQVEALARIEFLVEHGKRLGALEGAPGIGKTFTLAVLARELRRAGCQVAFVNLTAKTERELLWDIAVALAAGPRPDETRGQLWRRLADKIAENRYSRIRSVLLCDDLDDATDGIGQTIARLQQIDASPETRWTTIVTGTPPAIARQEPRLLQAIGLPIRLRTWDLADTRGFLQHATGVAGRSQPLFSDEAVAHLHAASGGNPRQTSRLAELALLAGAVERIEIVDGSLVDAVAADLGVDPIAQPAARY